MTLELARPLVVFDTETTGTDPLRDRIVEIAAVRLERDGSRTNYERRVNPGVPIPAEATAIHGIRDEDVVGLPPFGAIAEEVIAFLEGCDLGGYNVGRFDIPILETELRRVGMVLRLDGISIVDPQRIFFLREPRDLTAAYRFYCGRDLVGAHGARADAEATLDVLLGQLVKYTALPRTPAALHEMLSEDLVDLEGKFRWRNGEVILAFGQNKGRSLRELAQKSPDYLRWMIQKDFSESVKSIARNALDGKFPEARRVN